MVQIVCYAIDLKSKTTAYPGIRLVMEQSGERRVKKATGLRRGCYVSPANRRLFFHSLFLVGDRLVKDTCVKAKI